MLYSFSSLLSLSALLLAATCMTPLSALAQEDAYHDWHAKAKGTNLVAGRPAWLFPAPNWGGKEPSYYSSLLSDGKLSEALTYGNYETNDAVRWAWSDLDCIILYDLESPQPIEKIVARAYGGRKGNAKKGEGGRMAFPKELEVFVSDDKKSFHWITTLTKTLPAEQDTIDWKRTYYLEEKATGYAYTFELPVGVKARYIGLRLARDADKVILDEVAIIRGGDDLTSTPADHRKLDLAIDSALATFRTETLALTSPARTPNWIKIQDTREDRAAPISVTLELPAGIEVLGWRGTQPATRPAPSPGRALYELPIAHLPGRRSSTQGPLFLGKAGDSSPLAADAYAILTTQYEGYQYEQKIGLSELEIPAAKDWSDFEISIGWMYDEHSLSWPDFFDSYRTLGFNTLPTFPRYYSGNPSGLLLASFTEAEKLQLLRDGQEAGFKVVYNESPFHVMFNRRKKSHPEILNQPDGTPGAHLSPVYRGERYKEEIDRVAQHFAETRANSIFLDIELWHLALPEARTSPEYRQALKASGKDESDFLGDLGQQMIGDLRAAVLKKAEEIKLPAPQIGLYAVQASEELQVGVFDWAKLYPELIDFSMPSLYVAGDVSRIHRSIAANREQIGASKIIPWLTTATFGAYAPHRLEAMIYETLLNGANGFTYYWYGDMDPIHFYHHAKALQTLHPFKALLKNGAPLPLKGKDELLTYTAIGDEGHHLVLIGNYQSSQPRSTSVILPGVEPQLIRDVRSGRTYPAAKSLEITVPGNDCLLLEVRAAL